MTVNGATTDYTYNALNQLVNTSSPSGTTTYDYDGRGNVDQVVAGSQTTDYTYDAADRLANVTLPDATAIAYKYDADGRRIKQTVGAEVTNYLWDEASVYGDVVLETDGNGATLASYVLAGTELVSQTRGSATNYYLQDGQGSTRALTNAAGTVTDTYSYTAFGELLNQTGSTANSYLYTGQQFDSLTGLYDLRARYYDPRWGRFLSQDTYPVNFGNPMELNRYVYVGNNPVNAMDPSGHMGTYSYSQLLNNALKGAKAGAIVGFKAGLIYGIVASIFCGGGLNATFIAKSALMGAAGGALAGGLIGAFPALAPTITVGSGMAGYYSVLRHPSSSAACNFLNMAMALATIGLGTVSMASYWGSPPPPALQAIGVNGGTIPVPVTAPAIGVSSQTLTEASVVSLVSMMSGENGGSDGINPKEAQKKIDAVVKKVYSNKYFRRLNTPDEQIILEKPRYKVLYDPKLEHYAASIYKKATLIGPASIRGGEREILNSIIHEEIHHWLDLTGRPHDENWIIGLTSYIMGIYK